MVETPEHLFIQYVQVAVFWADFRLDLETYFGEEISVKLSSN